MRQLDAVFAALILASIALMHKAVYALVVYSLRHEFSSHIILIPFITIALIFMERQRIFARARPNPFWGGTTVLVGVALYLLAGRTVSPGADNTAPSWAAFSLVLIWLGCFLICYGPAVREALFPILFLSLTIPLPGFMLDPVIYFLQEGSTEISYLLFRCVDVPVLRQGFLLSTPTVTIEVATECSGIRSSMALFITCLLAAHLFLKTSRKMLLFVLLALPLALIKNGIRITTLTLLAIYVDPGFLQGSLHRDGGFVFFLLALAMLAPMLILLQRSEKAAARIIR